MKKKRFKKLLICILILAVLGLAGAIYYKEFYKNGDFKTKDIDYSEVEKKFNK